MPFPEEYTTRSSRMYVYSSRKACKLASLPRRVCKLIPSWCMHRILLYYYCVTRHCTQAHIFPKGDTALVAFKTKGHYTKFSTIGKCHKLPSRKRPVVDPQFHRSKLSPTLQRWYITDTYVKAYLFDGERRIEKRKTAVVDQCCNPVFRQAAKFLASDAREIMTTS